jgi:hypothetical protein
MQGGVLKKLIEKEKKKIRGSIGIQIQNLPNDKEKMEKWQEYKDTMKHKD